jgi:hypothetical protein
MKKALLLVCAVAAIALAGTKSYGIKLYQPATVGGTELTAGEYQLQLNGDKVTIKGGHETVEASAKVETADSKNPSTSVSFNTADCKRTIERISLGGTKMTVVLDSSTPGESAGSR